MTKMHHIDSENQYIGQTEHLLVKMKALTKNIGELHNNGL